MEWICKKSERAHNSNGQIFYSEPSGKISLKLMLSKVISILESAQVMSCQRNLKIYVPKIQFCKNVKYAPFYAYSHQNAKNEWV